MFNWFRADATGGAADTVAGRGVGETGLLGAVRVATTTGWRSVRRIVPGDRVLTFDCGMQTVAAIQSEPLWEGEAPCPDSLWPVEVPAGALGNRNLMYLAADQAVLVESDAAEALTGDPFALIPARSLIGVRGMCRVPPPPDAEVTILQFEVEQIVFANSGAMLHCPPVSTDLLGAAATPHHYQLLDRETADIIANALDTDCSISPWRPDPSGAADRLRR
ncbi:MAG TPA: Hint domain-containing protein [Roseovarius sp.]